MQVVQVILWYLDSGCSKHMTGNRSNLKNFVEKFIGTVRFGNDHFRAITGYGDYVIGDSVISRVYYVEGLGHNLFSVRQFYDFDLEVAFRKHTCFVRDINGADLLKGSHSTNLYMISIDDMMKSSLICLLSKASKSKSWMWHRRLNHLNFGTINDLARKDLVRGLPRLNKSVCFRQVKLSDGNSSSSFDIAKLTHAVNQQTSAVTTAMTAILKQFQATPPLASVKAVEEICVTCGGPHPYYQCLAADGNTFPPEIRMN
ncbi:integrase, catalytic region, zinc finger, CCHC-type containing protein [Tanacetum coccineum]